MQKQLQKQMWLRVLLLIVMAGSQVIGAVKANAFTQQKQMAVPVTGTVTNEIGQAMPGVNVFDKTAKKGTVTDANGKYSITANEGTTLVFSFVGYESKEILVGKSAVINVKLTENSQELQEVVAIGYSTVRKGDVTGAISSVKAKELNLSTPTVGQALVGKVAGVQVSQVSGAPYVSTKIRVRGVGSINASSDPLYVVDGYPVGNDLFINPNDIESIDILKDAASAAIYGSRASGGVVLITTKRGKEGTGQFQYDVQYGLNQLSKKVDLLNSEQFAQLLIDGHNNTYRDLIVNSGRVWSDAMFSDDNATRVAKVGNASSVSIPEEFYNFGTQTLIKPKIDTDWQNELYQTSLAQRHNLSFSGGNSSTRYAISGGYLNQPGIIKSTKQERINFRANIDGQVSKKLRVAGNLAVTTNENREVQEGRFNQGPILGALIYMPFFAAYNEDGSLKKNEAAAKSALYAYQSVENPVALATETHISRKGVRGTFSGNATYEIVPSLFAKVNVGLQTYNEKYEFYLPTSLSNGANPPGSAQSIAAANAVAQTRSEMDKLAEFTLNYNGKFGNHTINALAGYTAQELDIDVISVTAKGFQNDRIEEITGKGADATLFTLNSNTGKSTATLLSYLARVAYNYKDRYFLTASFRRDASSRFGPLNRWGNFPSVSASWNLSQEPFYADRFGEQTSIKVRASWGLSGNNNIGNYNYLQTMSSPTGVVFGNGTIQSAVYANTIRDQRLGWESTSQFNFGTDIGLFNNRIFVMANYYISQSSDLLFNQPVSAISGAATMLTNLRNSKVQNKGLDLQIDTRIIQKSDLRVNLSGNISINRNEVLDLGGANTIITNGAERSYLTHITQQGQPIGMFYGFKVKGMVRQSDMDNLAADNLVYNTATQSFPAGYKIKGPARSTASSNTLKPGDIYFEDVNGDGVVNDLDKTVIGTPYAKFTYGFALSATYKNFDLSSSFNGSYGNQVLDGQDYYVYNMEGSGNQYASVANRYRSETEPGDGSVYRASRGGTQSNSTRLSSFYLQDGSFLRCTNLTLGFTVPTQWLGKQKSVSNARIYIGIDNAFTITKYKGYNPEVDYNDGANLTPGVDYGKYPLMRAYNIGAKLTF
ncbi:MULTISPECIES: TonB-dependent receptor [unclassified Arcicella]|uniref:SusC/RagA family TonB-linked outer membrane protein n=1 Tax=unclassified Arcicella TaxID=2644986 RepID=UPI002859320E|nr:MULTISPECIES: TonB-dependent receptor [unclassified Arcicella]MDR6561954.1 TonB-linked SusC/RagA family outer membrane protein [Arcicella sp. BE51]MDR6811825.1 TonB-linked SusC/RagA family outer membrane protein [Arcicella sp. BE140]MDR6822855.1 TonB-linked SusC/RagA family outer membrane protein [Arcicella sp. BE139]